jgi:hypothetical protein
MGGEIIEHGTSVFFGSEVLHDRIPAHLDLGWDTDGQPKDGCQAEEGPGDWDG